MKDLDELSRNIAYDFKDISLQEKALTHRSAAGNNNERLEFLGDSILGFVISNELYNRFPDAQEGQLSRMRSSLVKGETLAKVARELKLGDFIRLGSGELKSGGYRRESILADSLEALFAAVYLDSDFNQASDLILRLFSQRLDKCDPNIIQKDPKTRLQEYLQAQAIALPVYTVLKTTGEAHNQKFEVSCEIVERNLKSVAEGNSRRKAEQAAAQKILELIEK